MSDVKVEEPYVFQPFGTASDPEHAEAGRLFGVGHPNPLVTISGLTRYEARVVCEVLSDAWEPSAT